jgi:hypothetical protein
MDTEDNVENVLKLVNRLESNCEFLTYVRHASPRTEAIRNSLKTLEEYWGERSNSKLNAEAMLQLFIELAYFHYACRTVQVVPTITPSNLRVEEITLRNSEKRFIVTVWYELQEGELENGYVSNSLISLLSYLQDVLG